VRVRMCGDSRNISIYVSTMQHSAAISNINLYFCGCQRKCRCKKIIIYK